MAVRLNNKSQTLMPMHVGKASAGFTYIALLLAVALMGVMLALTGSVWHNVQQREKERELLFIGNQFRQAIGQYYEASPGKTKEYPKKLEDLLEDNRYLTIKRYLRQVYRDPMTGSTEWGLIQGPDGRITGVYSLSNATPLKTGDFAKQDEMFAGKGRYADWHFIYSPAGSTPVPVATDTGTSVTGNAGGAINDKTTGDDSTQSPGQAAASPPPSDLPPDAQQQFECGAVFQRERTLCQVSARGKGQDVARDCLAAASTRYAECLKAVSASSQ